MLVENYFAMYINIEEKNKMSRIGNNPIIIPEGVSVDIQTNSINIKGKLGELTQIYDVVTFSIEDGVLKVKCPSDHKDDRAKHGLYRALVSNMIEGVSVGFTKELELVGVGYRASNQGQKLDLALGFSHNILFDIAPEVKVETISEKGKNPIVKLTSHDKQLLGYVAAKIRSFRKPEPYKGKGVRFIGEQIRRKAGKSA
jgi:large subunit ribosomal protein L6